jgi:hypothetical protein
MPQWYETLGLLLWKNGLLQVNEAEMLVIVNQVASRG